MELASDAMDDPAWDDMDAATREKAQRVLETIVTDFGAVLAGPAPLARELIKEGEMGYQSTLRSLAALVAHGLLDHRRSKRTPVFWVPDRLVRCHLPTRAPPPPPRRNGAVTSTEAALA